MPEKASKGLVFEHDLALAQACMLGDELAAKFEFHFTPKHGSWLNWNLQFWAGVSLKRGLKPPNNLKSSSTRAARRGMPKASL